MSDIRWEDCPYCDFLYMYVSQDVQYCPLCGYYYNWNYDPEEPGSYAFDQNFSTHDENTQEGQVFYIVDDDDNGTEEYKVHPSEKIVKFANNVSELANYIADRLINITDDIVPFFSGHTINSTKSDFCRKVIKQFCEEKFK